MLIGYARCSTDAQDLTAQHNALTTSGVKANRIYVDHLLARQTHAATLDLTTFLTTTVTTVAVPATPPTRPFAADLAWLLRLPAPGSVGVTGSSPVSSPIKWQVSRAAAQRKLRPAHDRQHRDVRARRSTLRLVAGSQLSPELDHLFLKVDHSLGAHGCQSNEFHDYRPYPAMAGKGFVELGEPVEEFPSDNGFGIERYPPHFAERREVCCLFGMGLHLASVGRRPRRVRRKNRLAGTENVASQATFGMTSEL